MTSLFVHRHGVLAGDGGGFVPAGVVMKATRVALRTTNGTQDITISGLGTPKAAIFLLGRGETDGVEGAAVQLSHGFTDGATHAHVGYLAVDGVGTSTTRRRASTTRVAAHLDAGSVPISVSFNSWITNGVRVDVTTTSAAPSLMTVILLGGASLSAKVQVTTLATSGNIVTVTPNFQTRALFTLHGGSSCNFSDTQQNTAVYIPGFASYDGSTIRQCSTIYASVTGISVGELVAKTRSDAVLSSDVAESVTLENITSTAFDLRSNSGNFSATKMATLALNFSGVWQAWAGVLDSPTTTGNKDFTSPGFQPEIGFINLTSLSAINTLRTNAEAGAMAQSVFTDSAEYTNLWTDRDGVSPMRAKSVSSAKAVDLNSDAGAAMHDATFVSWQATGPRLNFTAANGTIRKWPSLFLGPV